MTELHPKVVDLPVRHFVCTVCSHELPHQAIPEHAHSRGLPGDFACPACGVGKEWLLLEPREPLRKTGS